MWVFLAEQERELFENGKDRALNNSETRGIIKNTVVSRLAPRIIAENY